MVRDPGQGRGNPLGRADSPNEREYQLVMESKRKSEYMRVLCHKDPITRLIVLRRFHSDSRYSATDGLYC